MRSRILTASLFLSAASLPSAAQQFEVVSIKPTPPSVGLRNPLTADPSRVVYNAVTAKALIQIGYKTADWGISGGPSWIDSEPFDVAATLPSGSKEGQVPAMVQALLAERFQLTTRHESKELPVYRLIVGKKGPKLKPGDTGELWKDGGFKGGILRGHIILTQCSMGC
jgi:uncharacterized protein (TIGR03435 family)